MWKKDNEIYQNKDGGGIKVDFLSFLLIVSLFYNEYVLLFSSIKLHIMFQMSNDVPRIW